MITFPSKITFPKLSLILLFFIGFFIPIGSGITKLTGFDYSKLFPIILLLFIIYTIVFFKIKISDYPKSYIFFIFFIITHTLIIYILIFPKRLIGLTPKGDELLIIWLFKFFLFIIFSFIVVIHNNNFRKFKYLVVGYNIGYALTFIVGITVIISSIEQLNESTLRVSGGFENPNSFGTSSLMVFFINLILYFNKNVSSKNRWFYLAFVIVSFIGIVLSESRGISVAIGGSIVYLFFQAKRFKGGYRSKIIGAIISVFIISYIFIPKEVITSFTERLSFKKRIEKGQEERIYILSDYIKTLPKYIIQGYGRGRAPEITADIYTSIINYSTHNKYLNVLAEFGIIGLFLFVIMLNQIWRRIKKLEFKTEYQFNQKIILAFYVSWLIALLFGDYTNSRDYWLFLGLIISFGNFVYDEKLNYPK